MNARIGLAVVLTLFAGLTGSPEPLTPRLITIPVMPRTAPILSPLRRAITLTTTTTITPTTTITTLVLDWDLVSRRLQGPRPR